MNKFLSNNCRTKNTKKRLLISVVKKEIINESFERWSMGAISLNIEGLQNNNEYFNECLCDGNDKPPERVKVVQGHNLDNIDSNGECNQKIEL